MTIKSFFLTRFWRISLRIFLTGILLIALIIAGSIVFINVKKEWILNQLVNYANNQQSGEIKIGNSDLVWFRNFPDVAVDVKDLEFYEHPTGKRAINEKPILMAEHFFVVLDLWTLLRESVLEISSAGIKNASLNFETDTNGVLNIEKAFTKPGKKSNQPLTINLQLITLDNLLFTLESAITKRSSVFLIHRMNADLTYAGDSINSKILSSQEIKSFYLMKTIVSDVGEVNADLDLTYNLSRKLLTLHSGTLKYNQLNVAVNGIYDHKKEQFLDVNFDGSSNELVLFKALIKEDIINLNKNLLQHGKISMKGKISGKTKGESPQVEFYMDAKGIDLKLPDKMGEFNNICFNCSFQSGGPDDFSEANLEVRNLSGKIPGGSINGDFRIQNFTRPNVNYHLSASAKLDGYDRIFKISSIKNIKGQITVRSEFNGSLDLSNPNPPANPANGEIAFDQVAFTLAKTNTRIKGGSGKIILANYGLSTNDLQFQFGKSIVRLDASLSNPYHILFNHEKSVNSSLKFRSDYFFMSDILPDKFPGSGSQGKATDVRLELAIVSTVNKIRNRIGIPDLSFEIENSSAKFEKLPDIRQLSAHGKVISSTQGLKLMLDDFQCKMPTGTLKYMGEINIGNKNLLELNSKIKLDQMPISYVNDFINEFQINTKSDSFENFSGRIKTFSTSLDFSASIITKPFGIRNLNLENSNADIYFTDVSHWKADGIKLQVENMFFNNSVYSDSVTRLKSVICNMEIEQLILPGIGKTSVSLQARGDDTSGVKIINLNNLSFKIKLPEGSLTFNGKLNLDEKNVFYLDVHAAADELSVNNLKTLIHLAQLNTRLNSKDSSNDKIKINSAELNLSAFISVNPFSIKKLECQKSRIDLNVTDSVKLNTGLFYMNLTDLTFDQRTTTTNRSLNLVQGELKFEAFDLPVFGKTPIVLKAKCYNDLLNINFSGNILHAKKESGLLSLDLSDESLEYRLQYSMDSVPSEYVGKILRQKEGLTGPIHMKLDLQGSGIDKSLIKNSNGKLSITGKSLILKGVNIDKFLSTYEKSQNFDLIDVGAYVVAGPAGAVVTKGSDFVRLLSANVKPADKTSIVQLVVKCRINGGLVTADDVAFTTTENRIALSGEFDFIKDTIPGISIAVVDKNGCSLLDQQFYGKTDKIKHGKLKVASTLAGSFTNLTNAVADKDCNPFYLGTVKHPVKKK